MCVYLDNNVGVWRENERDDGGGGKETNKKKKNDGMPLAD